MGISFSHVNKNLVMSIDNNDVSFQHAKVAVFDGRTYVVDSNNNQLCMMEDFIDALKNCNELTNQDIDFICTKIDGLTKESMVGIKTINNTLPFTPSSVLQNKVLTPTKPKSEELEPNGSELVILKGENLFAKLQEFEGDTLRLKGDFSLEDLLNCPPEQLTGIKSIVFVECNHLKEMDIIKNGGMKVVSPKLIQVFPDLQSVKGKGLNLLARFATSDQQKKAAEAAAKAIENADLEGIKKSEALKSGGSTLNIKESAAKVLKDLDKVLSNKALNEVHLNGLVKQLGKLHAATITITMQGIDLSPENQELESIVGEKMIAWMADDNIPEHYKLALWHASEKSGHVLHNSAVGKIEQLFASDSPEDVQNSRAHEKAYTDQLKKMFATNMEQKSEIFFGKPSEETVTERAALKDYWNRNALLGRVWSSQTTEYHGKADGGVVELHPSYWGLFTLAPHTLEETTAIVEGKSLSSGQPTPYKLHPEMDPSKENGVELFGGEGHTRDYYMRVATESQIATFSTKGTGLDLNRPTLSDYYQGMVKEIQKAREANLREANSDHAKIHTMHLKQGDDQHKTVGFGDYSMATKDFRNFSKKYSTAKKLGKPYGPLTKALASPVAVVSLPKTGHIMDSFPTEITELNELPTQIVTVASGETSRRLHRLGREDQYRHQTLERTRGFANITWKDSELIPSMQGLSVKKGELICTLQEYTKEQKQQFDNLYSTYEINQKESKKYNNRNDPGSIKRKQIEKENEIIGQELQKIFESLSQREVLAPEDGVIFLTRSDTGLVYQLPEGGVLFTRKDLKSELEEWKRATDQLGIEVPEIYLQAVSSSTNDISEEEALNRVKIGFSLIYTVLGSMGVFIQEGDSTGKIGDSFEPRNISCAVRDADEWGKGQLRNLVNSNGEVTGVVTLCSKDVNDLKYSLSCILDTAGLADENGKANPYAQQLVTDVKQIQESLNTITAELFGGITIESLLFNAQTAEELDDSMGHRLHSLLNKSAEEQTDFIKAIKNAGVSFDNMKEVERLLFEARQKDKTNPLGGGKTHIGETFKNSDFQELYKKAKEEFKFAMLSSFKNFVAPKMTEGMHPLAELFTVIDGKGSYF